MESHRQDQPYWILTIAVFLDLGFIVMRITQKQQLHCEPCNIQTSIGAFFDESIVYML
jgi:hypothetical protein